MKKLGFIFFIFGLLVKCSPSNESSILEKINPYYEEYERDSLEIDLGLRFSRTEEKLLDSLPFFVLGESEISLDQFRPLYRWKISDGKTVFFSKIDQGKEGVSLELSIFDAKGNRIFSTGPDLYLESAIVSAMNYSDPDTFQVAKGWFYRKPHFNFEYVQGLVERNRDTCRLLNSDGFRLAFSGDTFSSDSEQKLNKEPSDLDLSVLCK